MNYKIIFLLIFFCSLASSMPLLHIQNSETQPGETILGTITTSGEFVQKITKSQIKFFQGRRQLSLESDIFYYNKTYYLYIYTNLKENITLKIENILDKESGEIKSTTITRNITISPNELFNKTTNKTYTQILQIKPGFIFLTTTPKIKLINIGSRQLNVFFNKEKISINPSESHELKIEPNTTFSFVNISGYKNFLIPVLYLNAKKNNTNISSSPKKVTKIYSNLRASPKLFFAEIFTNTKSEKTIRLFNFGTNNLTNLQATSSIQFIKILEPQHMQGRGVENLTLKLYPTSSGHFSGEINISYTENKTKNILKIPLSIFVLPEGTPKENFQVKKKTCQELSGKICNHGMICNGTATFTKNGEYCCLGSCLQISSGNSKSEGYGWIVAMAIFSILGFIGYYFYKKQKQIGSKTPTDSLNLLTKKFERRLIGNKKIEKKL